MIIYFIILNNFNIRKFIELRILINLFIKNYIFDNFFSIFSQIFRVGARSNLPSILI